MKSLLLVIDLQNEFINDNTRYLIKKIDKLIDSKKYDDVLFTRFINRVILRNSITQITHFTINVKVFWII